MRHGLDGTGLHGPGIGRVLRRGRSLVNCDAEIIDAQSRLVAKALATYKVG